MGDVAISLVLADVLMGPADWIVLAIYLGGIVFVGMWFGRFTQTTSEFFFGGQRFSWWLVAVSCIATLIGSYSFVQYSQVGFSHGFSSLIPYTNEWFVLPLFLIGWLPIIYYNRVVSVPEYFERRFDRRTRIAVLIVLLVYLQGYIGINLLTIGKVLDSVLLPSQITADAYAGIDWRVIGLAAAIAVLSGLYLHAGGQTSVMMTDLFQGILLLVAGLLVLILGIVYVGGWGSFWSSLPAEHRLPFGQFNQPADYHFVGNFWGDAVTASFAFWLINQGVMMRFLSAKSVRDGRKAMLVVVLVMMPIAAVAVGGAGWVARAMVEQGSLPTDLMGSDAFVAVASKVCNFGLFGLVVAAVVAALMSTLDTLITAVSAVAVNDVWRLLRPNRSDAHYLKVARLVAISSTMLGLVMLPVFMQLGTIYKALSTVINVSIPPLIVLIVLGIAWPRFSARAAFWTIVIGSTTIVLSLIFPWLIVPFAHGVELQKDKMSFEQFSYMRGLFGITVSLIVAIVVTLLDRTPRKAGGDGLTLATLDQAVRRFKGGSPNHRLPGRSVVLPLQPIEAETVDIELEDSALGAPQLVEVSLPAAAMEELAAEPGDLLYISDSRRWLGGFRSLHARAGPPCDGAAVRLSRAALERSYLILDRPVRVEKTI